MYDSRIIKTAQCCPAKYLANNKTYIYYIKDISIVTYNNLTAKTIKAVYVFFVVEKPVEFQLFPAFYIVRFLRTRINRREPFAARVFY